MKVFSKEKYLTKNKLMVYGLEAHKRAELDFSLDIFDGWTNKELKEILGVTFENKYFEERYGVE